MAKVISAKIIFRDTCDPDVPGDCAPVVEVEGASELEGLVSEHGIAFEEPFGGHQDTWEDELVEDEEVPEPELELESEEIPTGQGECSLEPDLDWDESVCGEIERRILSRVLGG